MEAPFSAEVTLESRLSMIRPRYIELSGTLSVSKPVDRIICTITDDRRVREEYRNVFIPYSNVLSFPLNSIVKSSAFLSLSPGEKTLRIVCESGNNSITAFINHFTVLGNVGPFSEITKKCSYSTKQDLSYFLGSPIYKNYMSWQPSERENTLTVTIPDEQKAAYLQLDWLIPPSSFMIEFLDADQNRLSHYSGHDNYNFYCDAVELPSGTKYVNISVYDYNSALSTIHVFTDFNPDIQLWKPMPEKLDILHISTHQDDELLFFGGSIPHYAQSGYETGVLYMADCGRHRYQEALSGLWICGLKYHPEFLGLLDSIPDNYDIALSQWDGLDNVVNLIVEKIRKLKPDVIVTHGEDGEYGHQQHIVTSNAVLMAVEAASNPDFHPESYEKYGAWNVKKLYRHQTFGDNVIQMDWNKPLDAFGGRTAIEMSEIGYNRHLSQISYLSYSFADFYPSNTFALVYSTVGPDVIGGDFFENIVSSFGA